MKKLGPGCNEPGWKGEVRCVGGDGTEWGGKVGCGAPLEVTKDDLYLVHKHDIGGARDEVKFTCPCGVENDMPDGLFFTDLPKKKDWVEKKAAVSA